MKEKIARILIEEVEKNGYEFIFGDEWEVTKKDLYYTAKSSTQEAVFWDNVKYISNEIANFTRR